MWRWHGESAIVVGFDGPIEHANAAARSAAAAAIRRGDVEGAVPGARSVLVHLAAGADPGVIADAMGAADDTARPAPRDHRIEVTYDGEDLDAVARETGLTAGEVAALHAGATYTVAFLGFMPGFAYLLGLPDALRVPRLASPRTRVPAKSVAIAGEWAGIYPGATPGGWRLIGRTTAALFDVSAQPPARLAAGDTVRFVAS